jgi:hypothetical protein
MQQRLPKGVAYARRALSIDGVARRHRISESYIR